MSTIESTGCDSFVKQLIQMPKPLIGDFTFIGKRTIDFVNSLFDQQPAVALGPASKADVTSEQAFWSL